MRKVNYTLATLTLILAFTASPIHTQSQNRVETIRQARDAYYNLKRQGFAGFNAALLPNWEITLGPTATPENLKVFRAVRFSIAVDADGAVTVSHEVAETERARVTPYLKSIHDNVERLVRSTLGMWSRLMVNSPFPENENLIKLENPGNGYRLFYPIESADVALSMSSEFLITELKFTTRTSSRTIKPRFQKTREGLLLSGYHSSFEAIGQGVTTTLDITIEYQEVERLKLPQKIEIRGTYNGQPIEAELRFAQYVLTPVHR